ncbi:MAG: hypothetical protein K2X36_12455, partial [Microbacteriaceae bacterium]|nr:hypothetical protein [Microbacteriaceae bacterium]
MPRADAHPANRAAANDLRHNGRSGSTAPAPRAPPRRRPTPGRAAAPPVAVPVGPCQGARVSIPIALATPLAERAFISALDLFKVGIGPSSSHTVGPLRAARAFVDGLGDRLEQVASVECVLFGSLGSTGVGHGTPGAVLAGLSGYAVETVTRDDVERVVADADRGMLRLG